MLVLIIMLAPTIKVGAKSYIADDTTIISSQYHEFFNNYFDDVVGFQYFTYKCNVNDITRNCYYGIDSKGNYINIGYTYNSYNNYSIQITKGIDEDFSVSGSNVFKIGYNYSKLIFYLLVGTWFVLFFLRVIFT